MNEVARLRCCFPRGIRDSLNPGPADPKLGALAAGTAGLLVGITFQ